MVPLSLPNDTRDTLLGGLTPEEFLRRHWQKAPLLVRAAIAGFESPLDGNELAGLACEDGVESRLVLERGAERPWTVREGPFTPDDFKALGPSHWSLLVQDVDKHLPGFDRLLDLFAFVPLWRLDDLMVSLAPAGGSVGPHLDQYDVFLLQGTGRRHWKIGLPQTPEPALVADLDLRILERFEAEQEWLLEPGDMLYLPPGVPHHGVATEQCMTWSIGFRAPSYRDIVSAVLERVVEQIDAGKVLSDVFRDRVSPAGAVDAATLAAARELVRDALSVPDALIDASLAALLTENKPELGAEPNDNAGQSTATFRSLCERGGTLVRHPATRMAYLWNGSLFVDGEQLCVEEVDPAFVRLLCDHRRISLSNLRQHLVNPCNLAFVKELHDLSYLRFEDE